MSIKKRINKVEKELRIKSPSQPLYIYHSNCKPTEEEEEIVRSKMTILNPYENCVIGYLRWENRVLAPFPRPRKGEPLDGFEWEWDYEQGIGFNSNMIYKFVGEFPKGKEFENDSQLFKVSNVDENGIVL
ncbi:hypothetical protein ACFLUX_00710 [Chloroflexota bacterium]